MEKQIADYNDFERELWLRKRENIVWKTKDGKVIPLQEMTTEHIVNVMNMLERSQPPTNEFVGLS
jgi:hypothetical protein